MTDAGGKDWQSAWGHVLSDWFDAVAVGLTAARRRGEWSATRTWRNGRRKGLKIPWEISREGSSPSVRTIDPVRHFFQ